VIAAKTTHGPAERSMATRKGLFTTSGLLIAASLAFDYSLYVDSAHIYVHEIATLAAAAMGMAIAWQRRSLVPARRATWIPLGLICLLVINSVVLGAFEYHRLPVNMHKLFWFEHGDGLRILVEVAVWVWLLGLLEPARDDLSTLFDVVLWGGAIGVMVDGGYWVLGGLTHVATTPFDLTVMFGLPLSAVFMAERKSRSDAIRLAIYGAGSLLLYSRASIIVVTVALSGVIVSVRNWPTIRSLLVPIAAGWIVVLVITFLVGAAPARTNIAKLPPPPGAYGASTISGSSTRGMLLRLLSIGDQQIAGYTIPSRTAIWRDALSIAKKAPVLGVGYHDYFAYSTIYEHKNGTAADTTGLSPDLIKAAHNDYLSMLAEAGVVGVLIYLGFWVLLLWAALRNWQEKSNRAWHGFVLGFLASLAGVSLTGEFFIPRSPAWLAPAIVWWLIAAQLLISVERSFGWFRWPRT
jgi:O-antigen ligase/polysaccharide polymerase Wzy-like membrane protein